MGGAQAASADSSPAAARPQRKPLTKRAHTLLVQAVLVGSRIESGTGTNGRTCSRACSLAGGTRSQSQQRSSALRARASYLTGRSRGGAVGRPCEPSRALHACGGWSIADPLPEGPRAGAIGAVRAGGSRRTLPRTTARTAAGETRYPLAGLAPHRRLRGLRPEDPCCPQPLTLHQCARRLCCLAVGPTLGLQPGRRQPTRTARQRPGGSTPPLLMPPPLQQARSELSARGCARHCRLPGRERWRLHPRRAGQRYPDRFAAPLTSHADRLPVAPLTTRCTGLQCTCARDSQEGACVSGAEHWLQLATQRSARCLVRDRLDCGRAAAVWDSAPLH